MLQPEGLGQHSPGQRPGYAIPTNRAQPERLGQGGVAALQAAFPSLLLPGALPRAMLSQPFGLKTAIVHPPSRTTHRNREGQTQSRGSLLYSHFSPFSAAGLAFSRWISSSV